MRSVDQCLVGDATFVTGPLLVTSVSSFRMTAISNNGPMCHHTAAWAWLYGLRTDALEPLDVGGKTDRATRAALVRVSPVPKGRARTPLSIVFAFVATHNHFVLDRGGKVFNRSAPVIKLPPNATEDDHLALLGLLNSSTACFWMKQVCLHQR